MTARRPAARVLFDESHSQAWTIRPDVARAMQPSHPEDSSYALAAAALRGRDLAVDAHVDGPLDAAALAGADVLVLAHPSDPRWERTVPGGAPRLTAAELDAVEAFVHSGGGLVVLAEEEQEKYANNLGELTARFGIAIANDAVSDYASHHRQAPHWVLAERDPAGASADGTDLLARVAGACFYRATTLALDPAAGARAVLRTSPTASSPGAPLAAVATHGEGRVVVLADSDLFGDDCLGELGHAALWSNVVHWAAAAAFAAPAPGAASAAHADPAWITLRREVDALRLLQQPDGALGRGAAPPEVPSGPESAAAGAARAHVAAIVAAVQALAPHFVHQAAYLGVLVADLEAWAAGGFARPDFTASLDAFRPDQARRDGIEHLVVFPMYKQNASRDTVFEALIVRVPWPAWLAELEHTRYDNAKFVPVELVDATAGYHSECAVLFGETVSVAGRPENHFGAIFCDREAERFRRTSSVAASVLRVNLPPDAAALLASECLSRDAYELWDLVHDRTHSRGDLPFDPFMIRQRMPFWMYALEELRCDLTAFCEAVALEGEGMNVARHAQYAILLDRMFRFPITGARVRNYDGLGGQLLFAFLHRTGRVHWTDNRLTIDWESVAAGVMELREEIEELYRRGIDRTKLAHWGAAHDLVAAYVPPAAGSAWAADRRAFADAEDPRPYVDEVLDDEFPLSIFYASLKRELAPALERPVPATAIAIATGMAAAA